MTESNDQDRELLDRALEQLANSWTFYRDVKIVAMLLLVFQFGIFFRFVDLSNKKEKLTERLNGIESDQIALSAVLEPLTRLRTTLQEGKATMDKELTSGRDVLRGQIDKLFTEIERWRALQHSSPSSAPSHLADQAGPASRQLLPPALAGLQEDDLAVLRTGQKGAKLDRVLDTIVDERIIRTQFEKLNDREAEMLKTPFETYQTALLKTLQSRQADLQRLGIDVKAIQDALDGAGREIKEIHLNPPATKGWWKSYKRKGERFAELKFETDTAVKTVSETLSKLETALQSVGGSLAKLAGEVGESKRSLDEEMKSAEAEFSSIESHLTDIAKPLTAISLDLKRTASRSGASRGGQCVFPVEVHHAPRTVPHPGYRLSRTRQLRLHCASLLW